MKDFILTTCRYCGNKGLLKIVAKHNQNLCDYCDDEPVTTIHNEWFVLECPVCESVSLFLKHTSDYMVDMYGNTRYEESVIFPKERLFPNVPNSIVESYEAAVKTAKVDSTISLIALRSVLEKICKERGAHKTNLKAMLKEMVNKHILPETLDECSFIIRELGNKGAHGDDIKISSRDVLELIDFVETIMYYIYELPYQIDLLNKKHQLRMEEREE